MEIGDQYENEKSVYICANHNTKLIGNFVKINTDPKSISNIH